MESCFDRCLMSWCFSDTDSGEFICFVIFERKDFRVTSTLDDTYKDGIFKLGVDLRNNGSTAGNMTLVYELLDANGKVVATGEKATNVAAGETRTVSFDQTLPDVKTWSSEAPNLYKLVMTVKENGKVNEIIPFNVGFRRIEIKSLRINSSVI